MSGLSLAEAESLLAGCRREELRDHSFGDCEVYWMRGNVEVAYGYFGGTSASVTIGETSFEGGEARKLRSVGATSSYERNDAIAGSGVLGRRKTKPAGEKNGRAKLTRKQANEIRQANGIVSQRELARRYGVSKGTIWWIQSGRRWVEP